MQPNKIPLYCLWTPIQWAVTTNNGNGNVNVNGVSLVITICFE